MGKSDTIKRWRIMKTKMELLDESTKVDTDSIARGFFDIIPDNSKVCMTLGMLPADFMKLLEENLKEKFERNCSVIRAFYKDTFDGMDDYLAIAMEECDDYVDKYTRNTLRDVSIRLIGIASECGICKV